MDEPLPGESTYQSVVLDFSVRLGKVSACFLLPRRVLCAWYLVKPSVGRMVNSRVAMVGSHAAKFEMRMKRILGQKPSLSELLHRVDH